MEENYYLLSKIVEYHDVGVHVIQIITIWRILFTGPDVRIWTPVREHVVCMFGLIINTVKASHLVRGIHRNLFFFFF